MAAERMQQPLVFVGGVCKIGISLNQVTISILVPTLSAYFPFIDSAEIAATYLVRHHGRQQN